ncbi:MAG TPA: GTP 3',8-cyclase MoaA [Syntrophorhabdus sp.]|nr:GTP 3',8-cyclase MoaA [Syntrophorhabdus sp.]HPB38151.1 GTP 3',8-cyclase MoaA [Syntrophorhabdus sp.]
MLMDKYNRVINYIRISVTDKCNLRCKYCVNENFPHIPHPEILRYEEIIRFVRLCAELGVTKVRLTGGEPLIKQDIEFLLKEINQIEGINDMSLTTNGVFLGEKIHRLKEAGLKRVNISLDSLKPERFAYITGVDAYDRVLESISLAKDLGLNPVKINTVMIKGFNDDEILDFARFAKVWDVQVRFIEFMPFGESTLWNSSRIIPSGEVEELIKKAYQIKPSRNSHKGPAKMFEFEGSLGQVGFISPMSTHICSECNRIRLTSTGMIKPCLFSDTEYDVKRLLRENAPDDVLKRFISDCVVAKPERKYEIGLIKKCQKSLISIGG